MARDSFGSQDFPESLALSGPVRKRRPQEGGGFEMRCARKHIEALERDQLVAFGAKRAKFAAEAAKIAGDEHDALWTHRVEGAP